MSKLKGFTPLHPKRNSVFYKGVTGFTLFEMLVVIIIIGILAAVALPSYTKMKEYALGKEAISNLKLIGAAERIYRMETGTYYPDVGTEGDASDLNSNLKVSLNEQNWDYFVDGGINSFTAYAARLGTAGFLDCQYSLASADAIAGNEPTPNASCP